MLIAQKKFPLQRGRKYQFEQASNPPRTQKASGRSRTHHIYYIGDSGFKVFYSRKRLHQEGYERKVAL